MNINPERHEEFKEYMAGKLSEETGRLFFPEDIYVCKDDEPLYLTKDDHYKCIFGDVEFSNYKGKVLSDVEFIWGNVNIQSKNIDLGDLRFIEGQLFIYNSTLESFKNLEYVHKLSLYESKIASLGALKSIKTDLSAHKSKVGDLGELTKIGGSAFLQDMQITSLGKLEYVGGYLYLADPDGSHDCPIKKMDNLKYVRGIVYAHPNQVKYFSEKLKSCRGRNNLYSYTFKNDPNYIYKSEFDYQSKNENANNNSLDDENNLDIFESMC